MKSSDNDKELRIANKIENLRALLLCNVEMSTVRYVMNFAFQCFHFQFSQFQFSLNAFRLLC